MSTYVNNDSPNNTGTNATTGVDLEMSKLFKIDRYLGETLSLPYSYDEIKIKSNDLVHADNLNACLYKLYYNFLYINAQSKIVSNNFPSSYKGYIASTASTGSSGVSWYGNSTSTAILSTQLSAYGDGSTSNGTILSGIVDGVYTQSLGSASKHIGFVANPETLLAFQSDSSNAIVRMNKKTIEDSTALPFTNIKALAINSDKNLFVADDTLIHKFDVQGVLTDNPATSGIGKFLIKTIGGAGTNLFIKDKFDDIAAIDVGKDDKVYVLDVGHRGYKIYDKDLNWLSTQSKRSDFISELSGSPVVDISVDKATEHIYILSQSGVILEYDNDHFLVDTYVLEDGKADDETYKKIVQSKTDDNIVYVMSSNSLFKKFKSKLKNSIGAFRLADNSIHPTTLSFVDVMDTDDLTFDYVFMGGEFSFDNVGSSVGSIFEFDEEVKYKAIIRDSYKTNVFDLSSVFVDTDEYVTSWVVNKSLHKLLYNHLLLKDSYFGKYQAKYDGLGRSIYVDVRYLNDNDRNLFTFELDKNYFVGLNEGVLAATINRPLKKILELQEVFLDICRENYNNIYPLNSQVVGI